MKHMRNKRLTLRHETVRQLSEQLHTVVGGRMDTGSLSCTGPDCTVTDPCPRPTDVCTGFICM